MLSILQPRLPPNVGSECYICNKISPNTFNLCSGKSRFSFTPYTDCLGQLLGKHYLIVMDLNDQICQSCCYLLDDRDKLQKDLNLIENELLLMLKSKFQENTEYNNSDLTTSLNEITDETTTVSISEIQTENTNQISNEPDNNDPELVQNSNNIIHEEPEYEMTVKRPQSQTYATLSYSRINYPLPTGTDVDPLSIDIVENSVNLESACEILAKRPQSQSEKKYASRESSRSNSLSTNIEIDPSSIETVDNSTIVILESELQAKRPQSQSEKKHASRESSRINSLLPNIEIDPLSIETVDNSTIVILESELPAKRPQSQSEKKHASRELTRINSLSTNTEIDPLSIETVDNSTIVILESELPAKRPQSQSEKKYASRESSRNNQSALSTNIQTDPLPIETIENSTTVILESELPAKRPQSQTEKKYASCNSIKIAPLPPSILPRIEQNNITIINTNNYILNRQLLSVEPKRHPNKRKAVLKPNVDPDECKRVRPSILRQPKKSLNSTKSNSLLLSNTNPECEIVSTSILQQSKTSPNSNKNNSLLLSNADPECEIVSPSILQQSKTSPNSNKNNSLLLSNTNPECKRRGPSILWKSKTNSNSKKSNSLLKSTVYPKSKRGSPSILRKSKKSINSNKNYSLLKSNVNPTGERVGPSILGKSNKGLNCNKSKSLLLSNNKPECNNVGRSLLHQPTKKIKSTQSILQPSTSGQSLIETVSSISDIIQINIVSNNEIIEIINVSTYENQTKAHENISKVNNPTSNKFNDYELQIIKETTKDQNQCLICEKKYMTFELLIEHLTIDHKKSRFECKYCKISMNNSKKYIRHSMYHKEFDIVCIECGAICKDVEQIKLHMLAMHEQKYSCSKCGEQYCDKSKLESHIKNHLKNYKCNFCPLTFLSFKSCKKHIMNTHKTFKCKHCNRIFNNLTSLVKHEKYHDKSRNRLCTVCGRILKGNNSLRLHMKLHNNCYDYRCYICGRGLATKLSLQQHINTHKSDEEKIKMYTCEYCGKRFSNIGSFSMHIKWHKNPYPAECNYCGLKSRYKHLLEHHIRLEHTKEKPHICLTCDERFFTKIQLEKHTFIHTGKYKFNCCDKGYHYRKGYYIHRFKVHGVPVPTQKKVYDCDYKLVVPNGPATLPPPSKNNEEEDNI